MTTLFKYMPGAPVFVLQKTLVSVSGAIPETVTLVAFKILTFMVGTGQRSRQGNIRRRHVCRIEVVCLNLVH